MRSVRPTILLLISALALSSCDFLRGYAEGHSESLKPFDAEELPTAQMGAARLLFDDFGALNTDTLDTNSVPWKLVAAALVHQRYPGVPATEAHLRQVLTGYGFIYPQNVANWPMPEQPVFRTPLGIVSGMVSRDLPQLRVEVANLGCSSCHAGVTYDATGVAQPVAWLGLPNTSLDLDSYVAGVWEALRAEANDQAVLFMAVKQLFPEVSSDELETLHKSVWSRLVARMNSGEEVRKFRNGGPGRSNDIDALKVQFHLAAGMNRSAPAVSIPAIGGQGLRWSVLCDGIFTRHGEPRFQPRAAEEAAPPGRTAQIVAFFSMPAMGLHPDKALDEIEPATEVLTYLANYHPPKYPGAIDEAAATRGAVVYARCAECHGEYVEREGRLTLRSFPNRLSPVKEIGTDPARLDAIDEQVVEAAETSPTGKIIDAVATRGYVAPSLAGIWATAPYLHNGSIPTLAALMTPSERPAKFWVGGHRLDFVKLGIAGQVNAEGEYVYPPGFVPWSTPRLFDTAAPGHSNRGHEHEFDGLTTSDKADLIEFLKQL